MSLVLPNVQFQVFGYDLERNSFFADNRSLHINCGGPDVTIENSRGRFLYEGDNYGLTGSATNYYGKNWGFSNTGDFMDDAITEDTYTVSSESAVSAKYPDLYQNARRSPLSLAYFAICFENGSYNVKLHFAEIQFSDEEPFSRLAKRVFNIYVQVHIAFWCRFLKTPFSAFVVDFLKFELCYLFRGS